MRLVAYRFSLTLTEQFYLPYRQGGMMLDVFH